MEPKKLLRKLLPKQLNRLNILRRFGKQSKAFPINRNYKTRFQVKLVVQNCQCSVVVLPTSALFGFGSAKAQRSFSSGLGYNFEAKKEIH